MSHPDVDPAILQAAADRCGGSHVYEDIVPALNRLAQAVRASGGAVAWVQTSFEPDGWPLFFNHMVKPELAARILAALQPGSPDQALRPELATAPDDVIVKKYRFSAFLPGARGICRRVLGFTTT